MVIAVDGPAGAGKSSVCRRLAARLGYAYLDTGAMYRAVGWALLREEVGVQDDGAVSRVLPRLELDFSVADGALSILYQGRRLGEELRLPQMAQAASEVSRLPSVRSFLTEWQRRLGAGGDVVAEGRDMATVVFPDASVKVFLTATLQARAQRRLLEYRQQGVPADYAALEQQIRERDEADQQRSLAPLRPAEGAFIVDTSEMGLEDVVEHLFELVRRNTG